MTRITVITTIALALLEISAHAEEDNTYGNPVNRTAFCYGVLASDIHWFTQKPHHDTGLVEGVRARMIEQANSIAASAKQRPGSEQLLSRWIQAGRRQADIDHTPNSPSASLQERCIYQNGANKYGDQEAELKALECMARLDPAVAVKYACRMDLPH